MKSLYIIQDFDNIMGLELACDSIVINMGSYTSVYNERVKWI